MNFKSLLSKFDDMGYTVEKVNEDSAIIYNKGKDDTYSIFDNTVGMIAFNNGFGFVCQADMDEMHKKKR